MKFKKLNESSPSSIKKFEDLEEVSLSDLYKWDEEVIDSYEDGFTLWMPSSHSWWYYTHEDGFDEGWFYDFVWKSFHKDDPKHLIKGVEKLLTSKAMPVKIDKNIIEIYKENIEKYPIWDGSTYSEYEDCFWILDECARFYLKYYEIIGRESNGGEKLSWEWIEKNPCYDQ